MKYNNILFKKYDAYTIVCQMVVCIFFRTHDKSISYHDINMMYIHDIYMMYRKQRVIKSLFSLQKKCI